jgi:glycosyltransferase involved in cell wall biosynthesis
MHDEPKRINLLILASGDLWGGAEAIVYQLAKGLRNKPGVQVHLVLFNYGRLYQLCTDAGIKTYVIDENRHGFVALACKLIKTAKNIKPQIIHSHRYKENILAAIVAPFVTFPRLVTTVHGISEVKVSLYTKIVSAIERLLLRKCFSKVAAVSDDLRNYLIKHLGMPENLVTRIYNGIDSVQGMEKKKESHAFLTVGSAGRLVPVKGYTLLTEIARSICAKFPDIRFIIAGDGPEMEHLKARVDEYGLGDRFRLPGQIEDVAEFYASLDIYINTSLHEGIPMTVLEAMSYSLPVIAPAVGGLMEIIENNKTGFLIEGRDPASFAAAIEIFISSPDTAREMGDNACLRVHESFSMQRMVETYYSLYREILV